MIKKAHVDLLRQGVYVHSLNSSKITSEVKSGKGLINKESDIEQIRKYGIRYVLIDTEKGLDVDESVELSYAQDLRKHLEAVTLIEPQVASPVVAAIDGQKGSSYANELRKARKLHMEAVMLIENVLFSVKSGKAIDSNSIEQAVGSLVDSVFRNQSALACLGLIRQKDNYLMEHSVNLSVLLSIFGKSMGLDKEYIRQMSIGAILHDIGKVQVPDEILHKPSKLTEEEFRVMKNHPHNSRQILEGTQGISKIAIETAAHHHEKVDGSGYPNGLTKEETSMHGRMLAIVDVYDAITADRVYHNRITPNEAMKQLLKWSSTHLDEELVHKFIKAIGVYPVGSLVCLESGKMGVVLESHPDNQLKPLVRVFYHHKNRHYLPVEDIDLSKKRANDKIVRTEDPLKYNIDIHHFMAMELD